MDAAGAQYVGGLGGIGCPDDGSQEVLSLWVGVAAVVWTEVFKNLSQVYCQVCVEYIGVAHLGILNNSRRPPGPAGWDSRSKQT